MAIIIPLLLGVLFGFGILISGMGDPMKVQNFFDIAGTWDPSLAFVMGGALLITVPGYHFLFKRGKPVLAERFSLPTRSDIDMPLIAGSVVFGIGWGIPGFCPGAVLPAVGTGNMAVIIFCLSMLSGMAASKAFRSRSQNAAT